MTMFGSPIAEPTPNIRDPASTWALIHGPRHMRSSPPFRQGRAAAKHVPTIPSSSEHSQAGRMPPSRTPLSWLAIQRAITGPSYGLSGHRLVDRSDNRPAREEDDF